MKSLLVVLSPVGNNCMVSRGISPKLCAGDPRDPSEQKRVCRHAPAGWAVPDLRTPGATYMWVYRSETVVLPSDLDFDKLVWTSQFRLVRLGMFLLVQASHSAFLGCSLGFSTDTRLTQGCQTYFESIYHGPHYAWEIHTMWTGIGNRRWLTGYLLEGFQAASHTDQ